jgi:UDP-N-acetylmuramate dehydrogenase
LLDLRQRLTARIGGTVAEAHEPATLDELVALVDRLRSRGRAFRVLAGGSNIIAGDRPRDEAVVSLRALRRWETRTETLWHAEAGVALGEMVARSARRGLTGLECCHGVPGSLGAAVRINAGGKWGTIRSVLREVTVLTPQGQVVRRPVGAADFAYRRSAFWDDLVLAATLEFARGDAVATRARIDEVHRHKKSTQPLALPSAGCIFRNPSPERPAGRLIDQAGLKGARIGGALVSPLHANYIVNAGGATGSDFLALMALVRQRVSDVHGVTLEHEVEVWD